MARPGRAYWKGFLRLSLVSIAVEIYNAVDSASEITFNQIHKPSGKRVNYTKTVKGIGEIDTADIVKGYEVDKDQYVILEPEEIEAIKLESKKTLDLQQFVDVKEIDPRYFERPYYLVPADDVSAEGYVVIREALKSAKKAGIGQMTMRGKENLVAVRPCGDGLLLETLRYTEELRKSDKVFSHVPNKRPQKEMIDLAKELIERKSGPFKPAVFKDHYGEALKALVAEKRKKGKITDSEDEEAPRPKGDNVVDLMDALKKSVSGKSAAPAKPRKAAAKKKSRR